MAERIKKGDKVKIISGAQKGTTATVEAVLAKKNAAHFCAAFAKRTLPNSISFIVPVSVDVDKE